MNKHGMSMDDLHKNALHMIDSVPTGEVKTFDYTFTLPGTYRYTCVPHEKDGMNGEVVVTK